MNRLSSRVICIISTKGGVGKTTTSINLASQLSLESLNVVYVDCDFQSSNSMSYLGIPNNVGTIHDFLKGDLNIEEVKYLHPSGLNVIPGSINYFQSKDINLDKLKEGIDNLKQNYEAVIIDVGPGLSSDLDEVLKLCDGVVLVTDPYIASVTDSFKAIKAAESLNKQIIGVVVNKLVQGQYELSVNNIKSALGVSVIGTVPDDLVVRQAQHIKQPLPFALQENDVAKTYKEPSLYIQQWLVESQSNM